MMKEKFLTVREFKEKVAEIDSKYDDNIIIISDLQETVYTALGKDDIGHEEKLYIPNTQHPFNGKLKIDNKYKDEYMGNINWAYSESDFCTEEEKKISIPAYCLFIE